MHSNWSRKEINPTTYCRWCLVIIFMISYKYIIPCSIHPLHFFIESLSHFVLTMIVLSKIITLWSLYMALKAIMGNVLVTKNMYMLIWTCWMGNLPKLYKKVVLQLSRHGSSLVLSTTSSTCYHIHDWVLGTPKVEFYE